MDVKFKTRFGHEVKFVKRKNKLRQLPGESFLNALVRTYYPSVHRKTEKMRRTRNELA